MRGQARLLGILSLDPSTVILQSRVSSTLSLAVGRTSLLVVLLSLVLVLAARRMVGRPLGDLSDQVARIDPRSPHPTLLAAGPGAGAELHRVAEAFNGLVAELLAANASLESKVAARTEHLERTVAELTATRDQLVASAKMAVLGQLVASVAHDLNTPLGAALSASRSTLALLEQARIGRPSGRLYPAADPELVHALEQRAAPGGSRDESRARRALTRELEVAGVIEADALAESLAEIGLTTPLGDWVHRLATPEGRDSVALVRWHWGLTQSCRIMILASEKMATVVDNLLLYSRKEDRETPVPVDLAAQFDTLLTLFAGSLRTGISVQKHFAPVPAITGRPDQLQQVWINLIANAIQAMDGKGTLELGIGPAGPDVEVVIANDGPPIDPDVALRLFTPFFTTKAPGRGTGLGLSICRRIVDEHEGQISFTSVPGRTAFTVRLPGPQ